jgi:hypothetical protein
MGKPRNSEPPASLPNLVELDEEELRGEHRKPQFDFRRELLFDVRRSLRRFEPAEARSRFSGEAESGDPRSPYPFTKSMILVNEGIAFGETVTERLERQGRSSEMRTSQRTRTGKLPINTARPAESPPAEALLPESEPPDAVEHNPSAQRRTQPSPSNEKVMSVSEKRAPRVAKSKKPAKKQPPPGKKGRTP